MNKAAAFRATVHSLRQVPSRKICQLVLELPIEETARVASIAEHGAWVAIARLVSEAAAPATSGQEREAPSGTTPPAPLQPSDKSEKRRFSALKLSEQAGIRCNDILFRQFLKENCHQGWIEDAADAASYVRKLCRVGSRADLDGNSASAEMWRKLEDSYLIWKEAEKFGVIA